jgi:hypothetical protein
MRPRKGRRSRYVERRILISQTSQSLEVYDLLMLTVMFLLRHGSVAPPVRLKALKADEGYGQVDEHLARRERGTAAGFSNCAVSSLGSCCFVVQSTCLLSQLHSPKLEVVMVSSRKFLDPGVEALEEPFGSPKTSCLRRSCNDCELLGSSRDAKVQLRGLRALLYYSDRHEGSREGL